MRHQQLLVAAITAALSLTGVGCTTSKYSRERAAKAVALLDQYEKQQKERIEKLNEEYVKVEAKLRQDHIDELERWAANDRAEDDRKLADTILTNWEVTTLTSSVTAQFIASKEREIERVNKIRDDLAAAQEAYRTAYQELALPLKKVQDAKAAIQKLSEKDASGPSLKKFLEVVNEVRKYVDEAGKKAEAERRQREEAEEDASDSDEPT